MVNETESVFRDGSGGLPTSPQTLACTEDSLPRMTFTPGPEGPVIPRRERGHRRPRSSGEVRAKGCCKTPCHGAMTRNLHPGPFQTDLEPVVVHRRGGNVPGEGQPAPGRGLMRGSSHNERLFLTRRVESPGQTAWAPPKFNEGKAFFIFLNFFCNNFAFL